MLSNWIVLCMLLLSVSGCAYTGKNVVSDAENEKSVSFLFTTCGGKYDFSQDCSNFNGAQREILIGETECRIAGSSDGNTILLQGVAKYLPSSQLRETQVNQCYPLIKSVLINDGLELIRVTPVGKNGTVAAYIIEFNSDAYSKLISYTQ